MAEKESQERPGEKPGSLRWRKKQQTRESLQIAALELVLERDFDSITIDDICQRAGTSRMTFFNHFPSKASVIIGDLDRLPSAEKMAELLEQAHPANYLDTICDTLYRELSECTNEHITSLRKQAFSQKPKLALLVNQKPFEIHERIERGVELFLRKNPSYRLMPEQSIKEEALAASQTTVGMFRARSLFNVRNATKLDASEVRAMFAKFLAQ